MCAHVQIHTAVLEATCTKLLESKAELVGCESLFSSNVLIIPVSVQHCPCRRPRLWNYTRHLSLYIALVNRWAGWQLRQGNFMFKQTDLANQVSSNSRGSCRPVALHTDSLEHLRIMSSSYTNSASLNLHLGLLNVSPAFCLLSMYWQKLEDGFWNFL